MNFVPVALKAAPACPPWGMAAGQNWRVGLLPLVLIVGLSAPAMAGDGDAIEFRRDVVPVLTKTGCNMGACHGSFQGRGGFRLSLLGFDPIADYDALVKETHQRRVSLAAPAMSLILRKPLGRVAHGGGTRFEADSKAHRILEAWVAQGTPGPSADDAKLLAIDVGQSDLVLQPRQTHQIRVTARWSDGVVRDVTEWTHFETRDEMVAGISPSGLITAQSAGRTHATVRFLEQTRAVTVSVPYGPSRPIAFPTENLVDRLVAAEWTKMGLQPAPLADDYEFCRRVFLDLIGTLPTPEELRAFVASSAADKRPRLIDALLERPEYVDRWAHKWGDLLRVHRRYVGERGLWTFHAWIRRAVRENRPVDEMVHDLLTAQGNLYTEGPVAFYFTDSEPEQLAETTAQVFLGIRMQCARCHHHPYEIWSQEDYYGLANAFTRIEVKDSGDGGRFGGAQLLRPISTVGKQRRAKMDVPPRAFGHALDASAEVGDVRVELADWIVSPENPYFARNWANRYWAYLMGRGLVDPVDDLRATNPASHPALLDALAEEFVTSGHDPKHLLRLICNSRTYQLAGIATPERDADGMFYTHRVLQRLPAAVLLDAINQAAGTDEGFSGLPAGTRAQALPDPGIASSFLETFGRSPRSSPCECASSEKPDLAQSLHLINSEALNAKIAHSKGRIASLVEAGRSDDEIIDELYLATLSRPVTADERASIRQFLAEAPSRRAGFEDLLWTLFNSSQFVFQH